MSRLSVNALYILSGLCAYAMLNHLSLALRKPIDRLHLLLACICFTLAGFGLSQAATYQAHTISGYVAALKWNLTWILFFITLFPWFIAGFTGFRPRWWLMASTFVFTLMTLVNLFQPYSLQFMTISKLELFRLPWGEEISVPVGHSGFFFWIAAVMVLANLCFMIWALAAAWRRDHAVVQVIMLMSMALLLGTAVEGILVRATVLDFIHIGPFGCILVIIIISLALSWDTNQRLSLLDFALNNVHEAVFLSDHDGCLQYVNAESSRTLGYNRQELIGHPMTIIDPELTPERLHRHWEELKRKGSIVFESRHHTKDGRLVPVEISANYFTYAGRGYNLALVRDVSRHIEAEKKLRKAAEEWQTTFDSTRDLFFLIDKDYKITKANRAVSKFLNLPNEEIIGKHCYELTHGTTDPLPGCPLSKLQQSMKHEDAELYLKRQDIWVQVTVDPVFGEQKELLGAVHILRDITHRKKLEDQLRQAQKMEAIGTLAGGIAHDFNNILSAILGYSELCIDEADHGSPLCEYLQEVLHAGRRAKDLVRQILAFSRRGETDLVPVKPAAVVKEALKLLRSTLPTTIEITSQIDSTALIMGDPTQVHQIIMNLCTNAAHAMEKTGGVMTIRLTEKKIDKAATGDVQLVPGAYLQLTVADSGQGIAPEHLPLIFEPYFSTKPKGEGTGLGLSVVHGIVHSFGGDIRVSSEPDKGTVFDIFLPIITEPEPRQDEESALIGGDEKVLFVDDEPSIAMMAKQYLTRLGYRVDIRTDSRQALELFKKKHIEFDLVITDMTMPHMPGDLLAQEMLKISPRIPIILCTGFSKQMSEQNAVRAGIKALAMKPLVGADLTRLVRKVLDEGKKVR